MDEYIKLVGSCSYKAKLMLLILSLYQSRYVLNEKAKW